MKKPLTITTAVLTFITAFEVSAFARAGGGGGSSGGGGFFHFGHHSRVNIFERISSADSGAELFLWICALIGELALIGLLLFFVIALFVHRKNSKRKSKKLLSRLSEKDPMWNPKKLDVHIRRSYFAIQKAWSDDKLYAVRHLLSDKLYEELSKKLDLERKDNARNVLANIRLIEAFPVSVQDRIDEEHDCIWYYIKGSMIDIYGESRTRKPKVFVEYWRFCKKGKSWVLDKMVSEMEYNKYFINSERPS